MNTDPIADLAASFGAIALTEAAARKAADLVPRTHPGAYAEALRDKGPDDLWYVEVMDEKGLWYLWFEHSVREYLENPADFRRGMTWHRGAESA